MIGATPAQIETAKNNAAGLNRLAYAPQPVPQADGSELHLCWAGRISRAHDKLEPLQADREPLRLIGKAFIAQAFLNKVGTFLTHMFPDSVFKLGDTKDLERAKQIVQENNK